MGSRHQDGRERDTRCADDVIIIPPELMDVISAPRHQPWSAREDDLLARTYPMAAANQRLRQLAHAWEGMTGTPRTYGALERHARTLGLTGRAGR